MSTRIEHPSGGVGSIDSPVTFTIRHRSPCKPCMRIHGCRNFTRSVTRSLMDLGMAHWIGRSRGFPAHAGLDPGKRIATVEGKLEVRAARDDGDPSEFGAISRDSSVKPSFLTQNRENGVVVLIRMCNRRVDCVGPDWTRAYLGRASSAKCSTGSSGSWGDGSAFGSRHRSPGAPRTSLCAPERRNRIWWSTSTRAAARGSELIPARSSVSKWRRYVLAPRPAVRRLFAPVPVQSSRRHVPRLQGPRQAHRGQCRQVARSGPEHRGGRHPPSCRRHRSG